MMNIGSYSVNFPSMPTTQGGGGRLLTTSLPKQTTSRGMIDSYQRSTPGAVFASAASPGIGNNYAVMAIYPGSTYTPVAGGRFISSVGTYTSSSYAAAQYSANCLR